MKNKTSKNKSKYSIYKKLGLGVVLLLLCGQVIFNIKVYTTLQRTPVYAEVAHTIMRAVDDMLVAVTVDAPTGRSYIASQRLVFPASSSGSSDILYAENAETNEVTLTTKTIMGSAKGPVYHAATQYSSVWSGKEGEIFEDIFDKVPNLQKCSRAVHLVFGQLETSEGLEKIGVKQLRDRRSVSLYKEKGCSADISKLTELARQVESY